MPGAILPDHWRAQVIFQGATGLPEDRFVNSFVFRNDGDISTAPVDQRIRDVLEDFYFATAPGAANPIWAHMAQNAISSVSIKCYDLGQTPPRVPVEPPVDPQPTFGSAANLPSEVALCLSLRSNLRTPRGRGRLYIGPLRAAVAATATEGTTRPTSTVRLDVRSAAQKLMTGSGGFVTWCVYSATDNVARPIIGGYVDDAFDTQRRRGPAPTTRDTFGVVV